MIQPNKRPKPVRPISLAAQIWCGVGSMAVTSALLLVTMPPEEASQATQLVKTEIAQPGATSGPAGAA